MQTMLHKLAITAEHAAHHGASPQEVKRWLREILLKLDEISPEPKTDSLHNLHLIHTDHVHLEANEIQALLHGLELSN